MLILTLIGISVIISLIIIIFILYSNVFHVIGALKLILIVILIILPSLLMYMVFILISFNNVSTNFYVILLYNFIISTIISYYCVSSQYLANKSILKQQKNMENQTKPQTLSAISFQIVYQKNYDDPNILIDEIFKISTRNPIIGHVHIHNHQHEQHEEVKNSKSVKCACLKNKNVKYIQYKIRELLYQRLKLEFLLNNTLRMGEDLVNLLEIESKYFPYIDDLLPILVFIYFPLMTQQIQCGENKNKQHFKTWMYKMKKIKEMNCYGYEATHPHANRPINGYSIIYGEIITNIEYSMPILFFQSTKFNKVEVMWSNLLKFLAKLQYFDRVIVVPMTITNSTKKYHLQSVTGIQGLQLVYPNGEDYMNSMKYYKYYQHDDANYISQRLILELNQELLFCAMFDFVNDQVISFLQDVKK
eukprot:450651_1